MSKFKEALLLKPRHKWFANTLRGADQWMGPCKTMEQAILEVACDYVHEHTVFVAPGRKLTIQEREEVDYEWEVDVKNAMEIKLPSHLFKK